MEPNPAGKAGRSINRDRIIGNSPLAPPYSSPTPRPFVSSAHHVFNPARQSHRVTGPLSLLHWWPSEAISSGALAKAGSVGGRN